MQQLSFVLPDCTISIPCSHFLQCGIIINSHLGMGCFPHQRMQWRFIATISKRVCVCRGGGGGGGGGVAEKSCTYTTSFWVFTVWPCVSGEVDEINSGWQMLNEYRVIFWGGGRYQGYVVLYNMSSEPWRKLSYVLYHLVQENLAWRYWNKCYIKKDLLWYCLFLLV